MTSAACRTTRLDVEHIGLHMAATEGGAIATKTTSTAAGGGGSAATKTGGTKRKNAKVEPDLPLSQMRACETYNGFAEDVAAVFEGVPPRPDGSAGRCCVSRAKSALREAALDADDPDAIIRAAIIIVNNDNVAYAKQETYFLKNLRPMRVYVDGVVDKLIAEGAAVSVSAHLGLNLGSALKLSLLDYEPASDSEGEYDRPIRVLKENRIFDAKLALRGDATMDRPELIMHHQFSCEGIGCTKAPITWDRTRHYVVCSRTCFLSRAAFDDKVAACCYCTKSFSAKNRPTDGDVDKGKFYCSRSCQLASAAEAAGITACCFCSKQFTFQSTIASSSSQFAVGTSVVARDGDDWLRGSVVESLLDGTYKVRGEGRDEGEGSAASAMGDIGDSSNQYVFRAQPLEIGPLVECEDDRVEHIGVGDPILVRWPHPARDGTSLLRTRVYMPPLSLSLTTFRLYSLAVSRSCSPSPISLS